MVVLNGRGGKAPLVLDAQVGVPIELDASSTTDPDGDGLSFRWFYYPEAGTGIPTQPVFAGGPGPVGGGGTPGEGGIPSVPAGLQQPPPRVVIDNADRPRAVVTPKVAGTAHVILVVEDRGTPSLTSYRRVVVHTTSK
jgi:hypothetical protein